jgi:chemotaxis protein MotB
VAYADFVTAMMALFIVLWLMNTSKPVQEAISGYFRDPSGTSSKVGSDLGAASVVVKKESMEDLKKDIEKSLSEVPDFEKLKSHISSDHNQRGTAHRTDGIRERNIFRQRQREDHR